MNSSGPAVEGFPFCLSMKIHKTNEGTGEGRWKDFRERGKRSSSLSHPNRAGIVFKWTWRPLNEPCRPFTIVNLVKVHHANEFETISENQRTEWKRLFNSTNGLIGWEYQKQWGQIYLFSFKSQNRFWNVNLKNYMNFRMFIIGYIPLFITAELNS